MSVASQRVKPKHPTFLPKNFKTQIILLILTSCGTIWLKTRTDKGKVLDERKILYVCVDGQNYVFFVRIFLYFNHRCWWRLISFDEIRWFYWEVCNNLRTLMKPVKFWLLLIIMLFSRNQAGTEFFFKNKAKNWNMV